MKTHLLLSIVLLAWTYFYCHPAEAKGEPQREAPQETVKEEVEVAKPLIEVQSADWCAPCRRLKASGAISELKKAGWEVKYTTGFAKSYPSFRVTVEGKSEIFSGYSSKSQLFKQIKAISERLKK